MQVIVILSFLTSVTIPAIDSGHFFSLLIMALTLTSFTYELAKLDYIFLG